MNTTCTGGREERGRGVRRLIALVAIAGLFSVALLAAGTPAYASEKSQGNSLLLFRSGAALVLALQQERGVSVHYLAGAGRESANSFLPIRTRVDQRIRELEAALGAAGPAAEAPNSPLATAHREWKQIESSRDAIDSQMVGPKAMQRSFTLVINPLLDALEGLTAGLPGDSARGEGLAYVQLLRAAEHARREQMLIDQLDGVPRVFFGAEQLLEVIDGQDVAAAAFLAGSSADHKQLLRAALDGSLSRELAAGRSAALQAAARNDLEYLSTAGWQRAQSDQEARLTRVAERVGDEFAATLKRPVATAGSAHDFGVALTLVSFIGSLLALLALRNPVPGTRRGRTAAGAPDPLGRAGARRVGGRGYPVLADPPELAGVEHGATR